MATVTTSTLFLQRLSTLTGSYPSATDGANGFDEVTAAPGDTIIIPLRSGSATTSGGGQMNFGYTPSGNTSTGGTLGGFSQFSSTNNPIFVTCTNVTSSGYISIWSAPSDGGSSVGFRARVYVNVVTPIDLNISITTDPVLLNSSTTTYTNQLTGCGSTEIYYASYTAGASQGDTTTYSNLGSIVGRTYNLFSSRTLAGPTSSTSVISGPGNSTADTVYIWAVVAPSISGTNITSSTTMTYTGSSYIVDQPDTSITLTPSTTTLTSSSTSNVTVDVTGDTLGTQYRLYTNNINRWVSTYNGGGSSTTDFTISYDEAPSGAAGTGFTELPGTGQTYTYFSQARISTTNGGSGTWQNTGNSFTVTRSAAATYTVAGPTGGTVNEGQNLTFDITTSNVVNGTTVGWTLSGLQSGDYTTSASSPATIQNNAATVTFAIVNDNVTDGNKTATLTLASTDSTGASTGSPSSSITVVDTSNPGGGGGGGGSTGGGSSGTYGLQINNSSGNTVIIDGSSRITNFLDSSSINTLNQSSKVMFTNFDCSDKTVTGFLVTWDGALFSNPTITRRSSSLGGITVTKNANDTSSSTAGVAFIELVRY